MVNMGVSGETSEHILRRFRVVLANKPKFIGVIILAGSNDVVRVEPQVTISHLKEMADGASVHSPDVRVLEHQYY
jgi:hypothetical protein